MRRTLSVGFCAVVACVVPAIPASASIDHHFTVIERPKSHHNTEDTFRFTSYLVADFDHQDHVGRDRGLCRVQASGKARCRATIFLNGEVGGVGAIQVNGNVGEGDNRLNVVGGTGDFSGVAGKMVLGGPKGTRLNFDLVG
jgi:hypothetical protein